jgi:LPXTG-motif cell wall-anchored protein
MFLGLMISVAPSAAATCIRPALQSPIAFTGTVIRTTDGGRVATVAIAGRTTVTVIGRPGAVSGGPIATDVDRHYLKGKAYEFHPINRVTPYRDNACTATHEVVRIRGAGSPRSDQHGVTPTSAHGAGAPLDSTGVGSGNSSVVLLGLVGLSGFAALALLLAARRRRRTSIDE